MVNTSRDGDAGLIDVQLVEDVMVARRLKDNETAEAVPKRAAGVCCRSDGDEIRGLDVDVVSRALGPAGQPAAPIDHVDGEGAGERLSERQVRGGPAEHAAHENEPGSVAG